MRTVKSLKRQSNGKYEVTFAGDDGVTAPFRLSEDLVVEYRLLVGKTLEEPVYKRFLSDLEIDALYAAALQAIVRAPKTATEVRTFLKSRTEDAELLDKTFAKLAGRGLIDDRAYALSWFDYHFGVRREGPAKILFDLDRKGLHRPYALEAVEGATAAAVDMNLNWLFDRKLPALTAKPREHAIRAMKEHLYRMGYDPGVVSAFCETRRDDFPSGAEEDAKAASDLVRIKRRLAGGALSGYALKTKIVQALMNKGYRYDTIKRVMEESVTDES